MIFRASLFLRLRVKLQSAWSKVLRCVDLLLPSRADSTVALVRAKRRCTQAHRHSRSLVPVRLHEVGRLGGEVAPWHVRPLLELGRWRCPVPRVVAGRRLDLDHIGCVSAPTHTQCGRSVKVGKHASPRRRPVHKRLTTHVRLRVSGILTAQLTSIIVAVGPASTRVRSTILIPASGRSSPGATAENGLYVDLRRPAREVVARRERNPRSMVWG